MALGFVISVLGTIVGLVIKYWDVIKHFVKATLKWLKNKVREKLANKKNGQVLVSDTNALKKTALAMANENKISLSELDETVDTLERIENEGHKSMMVDIDENGNLGTWEAVQDEDEEVRKLKGSHGHVTIVND